MRRLPLLLLLLLLVAPARASAAGLVLIDEDGAASALGSLEALDVDVVLTQAHAEVTEQRRYVVEVASDDQPLRFYHAFGDAAELPSVTVAERVVASHAVPAAESVGLTSRLVRELREPGVLRSAGQTMLETETFAAGAEGYNVVNVVVSYRTPLEAWDTMHGLRVPIDWQERAVSSVAVNVNATTTDPLRALYAPFHALNVVRTSDNEAAATYTGYQVCTTNDLVILLSTGTDDVHLDILPYRYGDADGGYFMALLTPSNTAETVPRDLVFVIDTSGSMEGEKIAQAREALREVIGQLSSKDRFTIVEFDTEAVAMNDVAQAASRQFVGEATDYVDELAAGGGTNLYDALQLGFDVLPYNEERPRYIVLLTDGQPTEGETDTEAILASVVHRNEAGARVFAFGIGNDVNTVLLDRLAIDSAGDAIYIRPGESVVGPVETFFANIAGASLVNPSIESSLAFRDVLPETMPDLFANQTLAVVGRYGSGGTGEIVVHGTRGGVDVSQRFEVELPDYATRNGHVPRVWATRHVGTILQRIKLGDPDPALALAATELAARYGVVTEFTNFVLDENGNAVMRYTDVPLDVSGSVAVDTSASLDGYQNSGSSGTTFDTFVRYVGARTLPTTDGWFTDTSMPAPTWTELHFGSPRFLELVAQRAEYGVAPLLAVARDVAFELHGVSYRVTDADVEGDTPTESDAIPLSDRSPVEAHASVRQIAEVAQPSAAPNGVMPVEDVMPAQTVGGGGCSSNSGPPPSTGAFLLAFLCLGMGRRRQRAF